MVGMAIFAQTVSDILVANMVHATNPGLVIAKKVGVAFFATRI